MDINPGMPAGVPTGNKIKPTVAIIVAAAIVVIGAIAFYYLKYAGPGPTAAPTAQTGNQAAAPRKPADLGAQIYEQAQNPIQNKLPQTVAPVANPLDNVYKNPFE